MAVGAQLGMEPEIPTVISLTALPSRFATLEQVLGSLASQSADNYEIHLNLPGYCKLESVAIDPPGFLDSISRLRVFRTPDHGPHTKLLPTLQRLAGDAMIITVDDDITYHEDMVAEHRRNAEQFPGCAIGYAGRVLVDPSLDQPDPVTDRAGGHFYGPVRRPVAVKILEGYKSVSYRVGFFGNDYGKYTERFWEDDVVISALLQARGVDRIVVSHPDEADFTSRAESFPVVDIMPYPSTGCALRREFQNKNSDEDAPAFFASMGWL